MKPRGKCCLALALLAGIALVVAPSTRAQGRGPSADSACLTCHAQPELKSAAGRSVFVDEAKHKTGVHADLTCTTCHSGISDFPHPKRAAKPNCASCHAQEATDAAASIHGALGAESCTSCHGSAHDARPAAAIAPQICRSCHAAEVKDFFASAHGVAMKSGDAQAPTCTTCHGVAHKITGADDASSPVAKKNQPATCGSCHANPAFLAKHQISFAHPVESYQASVHGRSLAAGNAQAASCSDCHSAHAILPARDPLSTINHWNEPKTCSAWHGEIEKTYTASVHGQAVARRAIDAPVCTDCHGDHSILAPSEPQSLVNPSRVSFVTCGRCHGDTRLEERYSLPADRVPTFADSFHGLATRAGSQIVANCASCHGVHNIFRSTDPRSMVNAANLGHTCGACHAGAGRGFAIGPVHVTAASLNENPATKLIRRTYWILIPLTIGFMFLHHFADFWRKFRNSRIAAGDRVERMNVHFRIAHGLAVVSFSTLVVTGFALKFPESWWARPLLVWEGKFAFRGTVHRIAAVLLLVSLGYHFIHLSIVRRDRAYWREMVPGIEDIRGLGRSLAYSLGCSDARPTFGRFSYVEKMEYLAFLWGTVVMAVSGFVLWFNSMVLRNLPEWVSDAATALHFYEAILATCAIAIWHLYTVVFDPEVYPMDRAWLTGKTSAEHLRRTRPGYYAELAGAESLERSDEGEQPDARAATPASPTNEKFQNEQRD